jgi:hypothetical protein
MLCSVLIAAERKKAVLQLASELIREVSLGTGVAGGDANATATSQSSSTSYTSDLPEQPPAKKTRFCNFDDLCDPEDMGHATRNELADYVNLKVSKDINIVQFWKEHRLLYPKLFQVANRILCIPATSSASERVFSIAGRTLEKRRANLSSDSLNGLLFLHSNLP